MVAGSGVDLLSVEYARRLLRALTRHEWNPFTWEQNPNRRRDDVHKLINRAIRRSRLLRGGWFVAVAGGIK